MAADNLNSLAEAISVAEIAAKQAAAALAAAETRRNNISSRIDGLAEARVGIVNRRATGDCQPDDGARLELITADTEGLNGMRPDADAVLHAARARQKVDMAALASAKVAYGHEVARLELAALDGHTDRLMALLGETLKQRQAAAAALPADQRGLQRIISRGQALEAMTLESIVAARAATPKVPYGSRPVWVPNDDFYNEILRLNLNDGRLS